MSFEMPGLVIGVLSAKVDLTTQFLCVKLNTDSPAAVVLCDTAGERIFGILQNKPLAGQGADVMRNGISKAVASGAITAGDFLEVTSTGKVATAVGPELATTPTLDFPSLTTGTSGDLTTTVTGAAVGDYVSVAPPAAWNAGLEVIGFVSATNTVTVRASNVSAGTLDAASGTFGVRVIKAKNEIIGQALETVADTNIVAVALRG